MATHTISSHPSSTADVAGDLRQPSDAAGANEPREDGRLLQADDVAELLGVPRSLVYALARRGAIPSVRIGERYIRFRHGAIVAWLDDQESAPRRRVR